jgi:hypothetical protein
MDMVLDSIGNIYVTGLDAGIPNSFPGVVTIKYNNLGQQIWLRRFTDSMNIISTPNKIRVDSKNNVYVLGNESKGFLVKYDSGGVFKWKRDYLGTNGFADLSIDKNGNIYVAGGSQLSNPYGDILLIKYNSLGDTVWSKRFNISYLGAGASSICLDDSNYVYITGAVTMISSIDTVGVFCTMKYDSLGVMKWVRYFKSSIPKRDCLAFKIKGDKIGNIYVTGVIEDNTHYDDFCTIKYTGDGIQKWVNMYSGIIYGGGSPLDMAVDSIGNVYVTGQSPDTMSSYYSCATIKYDTAGNQKWVRRYPSDLYGSYFPSSLFLDKYNNCYITGTFFTIKYDVNGNQKWALNNSDPQSTYRYRGVKVIIDRSNNMFITATGAGNVGSTGDILTLKYNHTTNINNYGSQNYNYKLYQNYPNPFNPVTNIKYQIPRSSNVKLIVYDILGKEIAKLVDQKQNAGSYETQFPDYQFSNNQLPSGVYFYSLFIDGVRLDTKKLILLK